MDPPPGGRGACFWQLRVKLLRTLMFRVHFTWVGARRVVAGPRAVAGPRVVAELRGEGLSSFVRNCQVLFRSC